MRKMKKTFLLSVYLLVASVVFAQSVSFAPPASVGVGSVPLSVFVADVNLDGKPDLLTANYGSNSVSVRLGDGAGNFTGTTNISVGTNPQSVFVADVNLDGKPDFLTANTNDNTVSVRLGDGAGNFTGTTNISVGTNPQ
ncbi:MAG: FG-GAP repeat domain-containing protein, partial [Candidatus Thermochlorobacter sp.]